MTTKKSGGAIPWMLPTVTLCLGRKSELTYLTLRRTQDGDSDNNVYDVTDADLADLFAAMALDGRPVYAFALSIPKPGGRQGWIDADIRDSGKNGEDYPLAYSPKLLRKLDAKAFWMGCGKTPWGQTLPKLHIFQDVREKPASASFANAPAIKRRSFDDLKANDKPQAPAHDKDDPERPITPRRRNRNA